MAEVISEYAVKVSAQTNAFTKEIRKLTKALKNMFSTKDSSREFKKYSEEMSNAIRHLPASPFIQWGKDLKTVEKQLVQKGIPTVKQEIKRIQGFMAQGHGNSKFFKETLAQLKEEEKLGRKISKNRFVSGQMEVEYGTENFRRYARMSLRLKSLQAGEARLAEFWKGTGFSGRNDLDDRIIKLTKSPQTTDTKKELEYLRELNIEYAKYWKRTSVTFPGIKNPMSENERKQAESFNKRREELQKEYDKMAEKESSKKGFFGQMFEKLKDGIKIVGRIFTRYLGYQIVKNFFGSMQEGMQNLYEWSRYHNQEFSKVLDKSKSLSVALGNATALFRSYATMWFEKVGNSFKEIIIDFLNAMSKAIAFLTGQKTYIQANKDIMVRWSENNAETRQLIQGFDKLNIWKGNSNTAPKDMFTEYSFGDSKAGTIIDILKDFFGTFWNTLKTTVSALWDIIKAAFVATFFPQLVGISDGVASLKTIWEHIKSWWNGVEDEDEGDNGETIKRVVEPGAKHALKEWWFTTWNTISNFFVGLWNDHLKPWFQETWDKISAWFESKVDPFITRLMDGIANWWTNRKQTTNYQIEDWVYDKTGAVIDIEDTLRQFKRLMPWNWGKENLNANGGVYSTPHFGILGEASTHANPELVTPTDLLDSRLQANNAELLGAMNGMLSGVISAINNVNMEVKIGDEVIAKSAARGNNSYYKQTGRPLIR